VRPVPELIALHAAWHHHGVLRDHLSSSPRLVPQDQDGSHHHPGVRTVAARSGTPLHEHDRDDCAQHAWERLIPAFRCFDPSRGNGASLLTRTVTNATKSWLRARIAQKRDIRLEVDPDTLQHGGDQASCRPLFRRRDKQRQLATDLWRLVDGLPDDLRSFIITLAAEHRHHARTRKALGLDDRQYEAQRARACRILADAELLGLP
jgi:DNA-directed RNA polymerase specialized sigma24 family protein